MVVVFVSSPACDFTWNVSRKSTRRRRCVKPSVCWAEILDEELPWNHGGSDGGGRGNLQSHELDDEQQL